MEHHFHRCDSGDCAICDGGLKYCLVCGGAESSLPSDCPGVRMTEQQEELISTGLLNFQDGEWMRSAEIV